MARKKVLFENVRVRVSEVTYEPGFRGPVMWAYRSGDVFLDDCKYERTDSGTGEKLVRERKSGEVIWHDRSEDAPVLKNAGSKPYRSLLIELKED